MSRENGGARKVFTCDLTGVMDTPRVLQPAPKYYKRTKVVSPEFGTRTLESAGELPALGPNPLYIKVNID